VATTWMRIMPSLAYLAIGLSLERARTGLLAGSNGLTVAPEGQG